MLRAVQGDDAYDGPRNFPLVMLNLFKHKGHEFEILIASQNDRGKGNMHFCGIMAQLDLWITAVPSPMCMVLKAGS
jgi:hypothetical protein